MMIVETIAKALGGSRFGSGWVARCPVSTHGRGRGDVNPSLSITDGWTGLPVFNCFADCGWREIKDALHQRGLLTDDFRNPPKPRPKTQIKYGGRAQPKQSIAAQSLWAEALPFTPSCVTGKYLIWRGFPPPWPPSLRFHPAAPHPGGINVQALVSMACRWPSLSPAAVQFTALSPEGTKAPIKPVRWTRGNLGGAAVQIRQWKPDKHVVLTEGIEDALAVQNSLPDIAVWAALGAGNVENIVLPDSPLVVLALDGDHAGREAAYRAAHAIQLRGHEVRIAQLPDGSDPAALFSGRAA